MRRAAEHDKRRAQRIANQTHHYGKPIGLRSGEVVDFSFERTRLLLLLLEAHIQALLTDGVSVVFKRRGKRNELVCEYPDGRTVVLEVASRIPAPALSAVRKVKDK